MREIKFRAWEPLNKKMHYMEFCLWEKIGNTERKGFALPIDKQGVTGSYTIMNLDALDVMQYTNLKDKNGKEIYDGDIVLIEDTYKERILDDGTGPIELFNHLAPVVFEHAEFGVKIKDGADIFCSGFWSFAMIERETGQNEFEVIGNICENPELLT